MKLNLINRNKAKILPLFTMILLLLAGCGEGGSGSKAGGTPGGAPAANGNVSSSSMGEVQLPSKNPPKFEADAANSLIPGYNSIIPVVNKSGGTTPSAAAAVTNDPHLKTIKIINNEPMTMYAMIYQSGSATSEYRIYVNGNKGIPGGCSANDYSRCTAVVAIPEVMWNGGRVFISTEDLFATHPFGVRSGVYTVDNNPNSINKGDIIYQSSDAYGVGLDSPSQLLEFTFNKYNPPALDFVGYNISYVDHFYLPVAIEDQQGITGGYLGTGSNLQKMDVELSKFINGEYTCGYFSSDVNTCLGWSFFYNPAYKYLKIPGGYNYLALANSPSGFNNELKMSVAVKGNKSAMVSGYNGANNINVIPSSIVDRWLGWVKVKNNTQGPKLTSEQVSRLGVYANNCGTDDFCNKFADTVTNLWYAGYKKLNEIDPAKYANMTAQDMVILLMGYSFPVAFEDHPPVIYPAKDPSVSGAAYKASISYPEAVKSVLRGVPYPFDDYSEKTQWYPDPAALVKGQPNARQKYNLDPMVWFVHKKLGISGYGFSIDDEISFVREPQFSVNDPRSKGVAGLVISIGGLTGIPTKKPYNAFYQERLITGVNNESGAVNWNGISDTLGLTRTCTVMPGSCNIAFITGEPQSTVVTINSLYGNVTFTLSNSTNESGIQILTPSNCSVSGKLDKDGVCNGIILPHKSSPTPWIVNTPPPIKSNGGGNGAYTLYFPKGWTSITSDNCKLGGNNNINLNNLPADGGAVNIDPSSNSSCNIAINGTSTNNNNASIVVNFKLNIGSAGLSSVTNCTATNSAVPNVSCNQQLFNINGDKNQNLSIPVPDGLITAGGGGNSGGGGNNPPSGNNTYMIYFSPEWGSISSSTNGCTVTSSTPGIDVNAINGVPGAATVTFNDTCNINLKGNDGSMFTLNINPAAASPINCTVTGNNKACNTTYNINGKGINLPPPSALK